MQDPSADVWDRARVERELPMLRPGKFHAGIFQSRAARLCTRTFVRALHEHLSPPVAFLPGRTVTRVDVREGTLCVSSSLWLHGSLCVCAGVCVYAQYLCELRACVLVCVRVCHGLHPPREQCVVKLSGVRWCSWVVVVVMAMLFAVCCCC